MIFSEIVILRVKLTSFLFLPFLVDSKCDSSSISNNQKINSALNQTSVDCVLSAASSSSIYVSSQSNTTLGQVQTPRALIGQSNSQPRSIHGSMNSVGPSLSVPNQGRPIVKVGMNQSVNSSDLTRSNITKTALPLNKQFLSATGQGKQ